MSQQSVLVIDDEPDIRELLEITLLRMGLNTYTAGCVQDAIISIKEHQPDLCLTDMKLPDGSGIDIVNFLQREHPNIPIAVITAFGSMETAVEALKSGAYDFVSKPVDLKKLRDLVETALRLTNENESTPATDNHAANAQILGESTAIIELKNTIKKLARSQAPVFIHGESGSGKELVAKQIHELSPHASNPFIPVNCGAIPENLMESEFFGHVKGSFTGATTDKMGLFQAANKGTLFLDEVADLPLDMQVKLLRAIQEKAVKPVGGLEEISVDVRILSATHKNLESEVEQSRFRQDLYYRLNVIKLDVPPLRDRERDVLLLADFFLKRITKRWSLPTITITNEAKQQLLQHTFPGNVRELENILERASTLCEDSTITIDDLQLPAAMLSIPPHMAAPTATPMNNPTSTPPIIHHESHPQTDPVLSIPAWEKGITTPMDEQSMIIDALTKTHWNRTKAAKILGMSFRQLRYRIKKYRLDRNEESAL